MCLARRSGVFACPRRQTSGRERGAPSLSSPNLVLVEALLLSSYLSILLLPTCRKPVLQAADNQTPCLGTPPDTCTSRISCSSGFQRNKQQSLAAFSVADSVRLTFSFFDCLFFAASFRSICPLLKRSIGSRCCVRHRRWFSPLPSLFIASKAFQRSFPHILLSSGVSRAAKPSKMR